MFLSPSTEALTRDNRHYSNGLSVPSTPTSPFSQTPTITGDDEDGIHDHSKDLEEQSNEKKRVVPLRERLQQVTWAWFTITMATGGISIILHETPNQFPGLQTIGAVVFVFNLVLFFLTFIGLCLRFYLHPGSFQKSLSTPSECLFFGTFWLTIATILNDVHFYGVEACGPWLVDAERICFWAYTAITFLTSVFQYWFLFTGEHVTLQTFTPGWIIPIFPCMLTGTLASTISKDQPPDQVLPMIIAGTTFQGLGFMVAVLMYSNFIGRLLTGGLPDANHRPGMFIAVGPPSFTALALIGMAAVALDKFPEYQITGTHSVATPEVFVILAVCTGIFLWALAFWFFSLALVSTLAQVRHLRYSLAWWAFVFPNVGFILSFIRIGKALGSEAILWLSSVATVVLITVWLLVFFSHCWSLRRTCISTPRK